MTVARLVCGINRLAQIKHLQSLVFAHGFGHKKRAPIHQPSCLATNIIAVKLHKRSRNCHVEWGLCLTAALLFTYLGIVRIGAVIMNDLNVIIHVGILPFSLY